MANKQNEARTESKPSPKEGDTPEEVVPAPNPEPESDDSAVSAEAATGATKEAGASPEAKERNSASEEADSETVEEGNESSEEERVREVIPAPSPMSRPRTDLGALLDAEDNEATPTDSTETSESLATIPLPKTPAVNAPKGSAIVQYHQLVQRLAVDGSIDDWAWDELDRVREELGISDEAHEQIVAELITDDPIRIQLQVDAAASQGFILGERCTMGLALRNIDDRAIDTIRISYTSTCSQGRLKLDLETIGPGTRRRIVLPFWPDSAGMHEMEGIIELHPLLGEVCFFEFGPMGFRVGQRAAADLNLDLDPSPVHIKRQPLTRGDPFPNPGLLGPPQWRGVEIRRIRKGAADIWQRRHPIRHPGHGHPTLRGNPQISPTQRISAVEAMWDETHTATDKNVVSAWQGPPLRTVFRECLDSDGNVDKFHSLFEVLAGDERLLATTAGAAFGAQLRSKWDWVRSPAYGAEVCKQVRRNGVEHVQRLLCAPTGWQGQPPRFKRRDITSIMGHAHDRMEEIQSLEAAHASKLVNFRSDGRIDTWENRKVELRELCRLCSLLIDAYQNIHELNYTKRQELDNMAWSTRRDGLVLYLETAQMLKTLGFSVKPTMRTVTDYREDSG